MTSDQELSAFGTQFAEELEAAIASAIAKALAPIEARVRELEQRELDDLLDDD